MHLLKAHCLLTTLYMLPVSLSTINLLKFFPFFKLVKRGVGKMACRRSQGCKERSWHFPPHHTFCILSPEVPFPADVSWCLAQNVWSLLGVCVVSVSPGLHIAICYWKNHPSIARLPWDLGLESPHLSGTPLELCIMTAPGMDKMQRFDLSPGWRTGLSKFCTRRSAPLGLVQPHGYSRLVFCSADCDPWPLHYSLPHIRVHTVEMGMWRQRL